VASNLLGSHYLACNYSILSLVSLAVTMLSLPLVSLLSMDTYNI
jgi:hypothetical protein